MNDSIKVKIADIRAGGTTIEALLDAEFFGLTDDDYVHFTAPVKIENKCQRIDNTVLASVTASTIIATYCSRTLQTVEKNWTQEFNLDFEIQPNMEYIDMAEDIRQEIIMRLPVRVLSEEEEGKDFHSRIDGVMDDDLDRDEQTHQPFAKLKDIE